MRCVRVGTSRNGPLTSQGAPSSSPVDDEVGVEHVAGCQVAVGAPVVGTCRIVAWQHLASVGADAHLGRCVAVGLCECITREDEAVAVSDVGQTESSGVCGAQPQAFAQERSVGEILPVERHPEPSEPLLPRERIGDDGSAVGEFLLRGRGVVPKRHVGTDRAAVHGEFEERFAVGREQFGAVFLIEKRDGADAAVGGQKRALEIVVADRKPVFPGGGVSCAERAEKEQCGENPYHGQSLILLRQK